ncbi:MAG: ATP-grasp domain-containing protein, partial [Methyloversatilis sp.]|nr:ATP-grasp domain-containing protein [Methyloversatilis sp.]
MKPVVLITLGRLPKGLDLVRSFHRLGWRVIVAEPFRWHLSAMSNAVARRYTVTAPALSRERYLDELRDIVLKEGVDLVVPVSEEIMHASHLAGRLPVGVQLFAMPPEVLMPLHDKLQFIGRCRDYGVAAPATCALGTPGAADLAQAGDHIVKPVYSCSGRGVRFRRQGEALPEVTPGQPAIVQRWVKGNVLSTFSIAAAGQPLVTVVYRGAVMSGTVSVCFERVTEDDPQHRPVIDWVSRFIAAAGFTGFISFDLVVDADGQAHGIECNPRATSGLHFVDPDDLARAVVAPDGVLDGTQPVRFRKQSLLQQFYPCLTEVQKSMFSPKAFGPDFRRNLARFVRARDVTWQWRDPLPFITMPLTASQIIWLSIRSGATFGEVATLDVGLYAPDEAAAASGNLPGLTAPTDPDTPSVP